MGLRIATNVQSLAAQRSLGNNKNMQNRALEKLSSGSRINRAGDDAAGLAISEKLRASIRSIKQSTRNASDGISMVQVAEGAFNEIGNMLIRMRELSIQAASDTIGSDERSYIDMEVQHLKSEIDRISKVTEFNGMKLINGDTGDLEVQVGIKNNPEEDRLKFEGTKYTATLAGLGIEGVNTLDKESAQNNLEAVDVAINSLNRTRSELGALQNRLFSTINNQNIYRENMEGANSRIRDTDMAEETSELVKSNILTQATISVLGQANTNAQAALNLLS